MTLNQLTKKQAITAAFAVLVLLVLMFFVLGTSEGERERQVVSLPAMGTLPSLSDAMREDDVLREQVIKLFSHDTAYLFVNYREVNTTVADILFLWAGMTPEMVRKSSGKTASEIFLRRIHSLPADEPIENNPLLGDRPWARVFGEAKARLLMQGNGIDIYEGQAYYDPIENEMVINAILSEEFMKNFKNFVNNQPKSEQLRYRNNMYNFVDNTKGLKNLTANEKFMVR